MTYQQTTQAWSEYLCYCLRNGKSPTPSEHKNMQQQLKQWDKFNQGKDTKCK